MAEDLKNLIEKINQEGVKAAEDKARDIENEAASHAKAIIEKAKRDADKIITDAKREVAKIEKSGEIALKQAGRNLIISLKKEISSVLNRLILLRVRDELKPGAMAKIISSLIKNYKGQDKTNIVVSLNKRDLGSIEKTFLAKLKDGAKKGITLKQAEDIQGGFVISYDSGRVHYDFTDKALAEYISLYLKPKLGELLKGTHSSGSKKT